MRITFIQHCLCFRKQIKLTLLQGRKDLALTTFLLIYMYEHSNSINFGLMYTGSKSKSQFELALFQAVNREFLFERMHGLGLWCWWRIRWIHKRENRNFMLVFRSQLVVDKPTNKPKTPDRTTPSMCGCWENIKYSFWRYCIFVLLWNRNKLTLTSIHSSRSKIALLTKSIAGSCCLKIAASVLVALRHEEKSKPR